MASAKREFQPEDDPEPQQSESKRIRSHADNDSPKTQPSRNSVVLNPADCNLDFDIGGDGLKGSALHEEGFSYCWSGARANFGITGGKYCFGCKVISSQPVNMEDTHPDQQHVCRIGISRGDDAVGSLGETPHSFGLGGTGKFSTSGIFSDYGEKFGVGDTIVCAVDLESKPLASIGFSKNGKWLGIAKEFDAGPRGLGVVDSPMKELQWGSALFAHVLLKNVVVQLHFSAEDGLVPEEGYKSWASALEDGNAIKGPVFSDIRDCEVMMMVGLPASGKTTWADKWVKEHPEKCYVLLGTNLILDQMKVPGLLRKHNYGERFDRLISQANAIFDILLSRAARTPRNYVIDQTNVFKSARKRKLRPFSNFHKIAVVVFPKPEELKFRADKRYKEMGKEVPADAVNNMLANYVLPMSKNMPGSDELFDQVIFAELGRVEAQRYLEEMKQGLNTNSASVSSSMGPSVQNQGVGGGKWGTSHLPPALGPPHLLNYEHQITNQQAKTLCQVEASYSGAYQSYQYPSVPRAPAPYSSYESFVPPHNGNPRSYGAVPGCRTGPYQSYVAIDPYSRTNLDVKNTTIYGDAATFDPYRSNVIEASPVGTRRSSSFTCNISGGPPNVQVPIASTYHPSASPPYGSYSNKIDIDVHLLVHKIVSNCLGSCIKGFKATYGKMRLNLVNIGISFLYGTVFNRSVLQLEAKSFLRVYKSLIRRLMTISVFGYCLLSIGLLNSDLFIYWLFQVQFMEILLGQCLHSQLPHRGPHIEIILVLCSILRDITLLVQGTINWCKYGLKKEITLEFLKQY